VLVALIVPVVQRVRATAATVQCANNMRQIGQALHHFHDVNGAFPTKANPLFYGWMYQVLPFMEQDALYEQGRSDTTPYWSKTAQTVVTAYICPSEPRGYAGGVFSDYLDSDKKPVLCAMTTYLGVLGKSPSDPLPVTGVFGNVAAYFSGEGMQRVRIADITDGTSNTLMVGERPPRPDHAIGWWALLDLYDNTLWATGVPSMVTENPSGAPCPGRSYFSQGDLVDYCHTNHFWSFHAGGANWLLCDGSVRFLEYAAGTTVVPLMATMNGGEELPALD
jgi:prepilin-type processing-associated H-X9-DG protein